LAVDQYQQVHEEVADFLESLRQAVRRQADAQFEPLDVSPLTAAAEKRMAKALSAPTEFEFIDTPLQDILDTIEDVHKIPIEIDQRALDEVGIPSDTPITKSVKGISLRSALRLMLKDLDLTYMVRDEVLLITTPEEVECALVTKVYPLNHLQAGRAEAARSEQPYVDSLVATVTKMIARQTWENVGGAGSLSVLSLNTLEALVVAQTRDVHEQIEGLLARPEFRRSGSASPERAPKPALRRERR
jgi:hypothetical protein